MSTSVVIGETYPQFVVDLSHENRSYPKVVPQTDFGCQKWSSWTTFGCQNWSSWTTFGCQNWSHLAKTGPSKTKYSNQNQFGGTTFGSWKWSPGPVWVATNGSASLFWLLRRLSRYMQTIYMNHKQKGHSYTCFQRAITGEQTSRRIAIVCSFYTMTEIFRLKH